MGALKVLVGCVFLQDPPRSRERFLSSKGDSPVATHRTCLKWRVR